MTKDSEPQAETPSADGETPSTDGSNGAGYRARTDDIQLGKVDASGAAAPSTAPAAADRAQRVPDVGDLVECYDTPDVDGPDLVGRWILCRVVKRLLPLKAPLFHIGFEGFEADTLDRLSTRTLAFMRSDQLEGSSWRWPPPPRGEVPLCTCGHPAREHIGPAGCCIAEIETCNCDSFDEAAPADEANRAGAVLRGEVQQDPKGAVAAAAAAAATSTTASGADGASSSVPAAAPATTEGRGEVPLCACGHTRAAHEGEPKGFCRHCTCSSYDPTPALEPSRGEVQLPAAARPAPGDAVEVCNDLARDWRTAKVLRCDNFGMLVRVAFPEPLGELTVSRAWSDEGRYWRRPPPTPRPQPGPYYDAPTLREVTAGRAALALAGELNAVEEQLHRLQEAVRGHLFGALTAAELGTVLCSQLPPHRAANLRADLATLATKQAVDRNADTLVDLLAEKGVQS